MKNETVIIAFTPEERTDICIAVTKHLSDFKEFLADYKAVGARETEVKLFQREINRLEQLFVKVNNAPITNVSESHPNANDLDNYSTDSINS